MNRQSGLTLIEMLVSLVILSFLSVIGYQGIGFIVDKSRKNSSRLEEGYQMHQALQWMRKSLEALDNKVQKNSQSYVVDMAGERDEITYRCHIASRVTWHKGYCHVRHDSSSSQIVLDYSEKDTAGRSAYQSQATMIENIANLSIRYFGRDGKGVDTWQDTWILQNTLPLAVEYRVIGLDNRVSTVLVYVNTRYNR